MDLGQQFTRLQRGLIIVDEKFIQAQRSLPLAARERDFGVERDQACARIGQRIAGGEIAAHRAHVADPRLGDFTKSFVEQGIVLLHGGRKLDVAMARAGADAQAVFGVVR